MIRVSTTNITALSHYLMAVVQLGCFCLSTSAFQPMAPFLSPLSSSTAITTALLMSSNNDSPTTPQEMFASAGWQPIKAELDTLPIFCCANEKGQPLQYRVNDDTTMPFFYCHVQAAEAELSKARAELPDDVASKLGIIPFPLGQAFELMAQNQAAIIPSAAALEKAGAPAGTNPLGQQVPLFCCMDIMQARPSDGQPVLPIFMEYDQAHAAMKEALEADGGDPKDFEVVSLSLPRAVELLATNEDAPSFHFLPSPDSIEYIQTYLDNDSQPPQNDTDKDKKSKK